MTICKEWTSGSIAGATAARHLGSKAGWLSCFESFRPAVRGARDAPLRQQSSGYAVGLSRLVNLDAALLRPVLLPQAGSKCRTRILAGGLAWASLVVLVPCRRAGLLLAFLSGLGMGPPLPKVLQLPIESRTP